MNIACDGQDGIKENKFATLATVLITLLTLEEVFWHTMQVENALEHRTLNE